VIVMASPQLVGRVVQVDADEDLDLVDCCCHLLAGIHAAGACAGLADEV
jgi:hypothetical protein